MPRGTLSPWDTKARILELGADLKVGTRVRTVCPLCGGGQDSERSLSLTRTSYGFAAKCWRATCTFGNIFIGKTATAEEREEGKLEQTDFTPTFYEGETCSIPPYITKYLEEKYSLGAEELGKQGFLYAPINKQQTGVPGRLYMPTFDYSGEQVGENLKALDKHSKPKTLAYWRKDVAKLHYPKHKHGVSDTVVCVEDVLSAVRISPLIQSVALLGSDLTDSIVTELSSRFTTLILALDRDTWDSGKPVQYRNKYRCAFDNFYLLYITKDFKDMNQADVNAMLLGGGSSEY